MCGMGNRAAINAYLNFVLYAVYGRMGVADALLRKHRAEVESVAAALNNSKPVQRRRLYRGVLLEPELLRGGKLPHQDSSEFISFSEDPDVACWFADRDSVISGFVKVQRPRVQGFIIEAAPPSPAEILFHHSWADYLGLEKLAYEHPEIDPTQFHWNVTTQKEAILKPPRGVLTVTPYEKFPHKTTAALDKKFCHPLFLGDA